MSKGYYSIVQYIPNIARGEGVNVGVVLIIVDDEAEVYVRMSPDNDRVRKFFGPIDDALVTYEKKSVENRINNTDFKSIDGVRDYIRTRANNIRLTELRSILIDAHILTIMDELYAELVN